MSDNNKFSLPFQGGNESAETLKKAAEECFSVATHSALDMKTLKSYMEPAFTQEGYRTDYDGATKSILIVRLDEIGDNVMTSGFIRELRKNYPKAHITLIVNPTVYPLVELCPYVNEVIGFSVAAIQNLGTRLVEILKLCYHKLWARHFDLAFLPRWDMDLPYFAVFLAYFSGARERIGYGSNVYERRKNNESYVDELLTTAVVSPPDVVHESARNFYLLKAYNLKVDDYRLEIWYSLEDFIAVKRKLTEFSGGRKIIAVTPGGNTANKIYPPDKFIIALNKIKKKGNCFVLLGGSREKQLCEQICAKLPNNAALNLAGVTHLRETAAAVQLSSMYIGMDTGAKHMAAALKLPVIEINCSALSLEPSPLLWVDRFAPWQTPAIILRPKKPLSPCKESKPPKGCENLQAPHCITQINPDDIVKAYEKLSDVVIYTNTNTNKFSSNL